MSSVTTEACPLTRGSSSEVVLGGGFLGGGGGGGGGGSLSEYLYERWGGLKSRHDEKMKCQSVTYLPSRKIGDPLYTTFQKIFTIIRIFLKSEAPKALYSSHSFIVSALKNGFEVRGREERAGKQTA